MSERFPDPNEEQFNPISTMESAPILEETYPLIPPFSYCLIQTDPITNRTQYIVVEVPLERDEQKKFEIIKQILIEELDVDFSLLKEKSRAAEYLRRKVFDIVKDYNLKVQDESFDRILYYVQRDLLGFGKIEPILKDHMIEDISCDGVGVPIYVWHRKYESIPTNVAFEEAEELDKFVIKLAQRSGRHISVANPIVDASLEDGSRINITYGKEVTQRGSTFTIRKFKSDPMTITDLIILNSLDPLIGAFYWFVIENRHSVMIAGGVAAGKTTLLNCISMFIQPDAKIISIEDTAEVNLPHENWIPSVTRLGFGGIEKDGKKRGEISMFDLLKAALRQRPDYILVGEIRGEEAYMLFQSMATGHLGLSTIHGDSVESVIHRLESEPMNIPRSLLRSLDIIAVQAKVRFSGKFVRRAVEVTEIAGVDPVTNELLTNPIFKWNPREDNYSFFGRSYIVERITERTGYTEKECWQEIEQRKTVLRWMVKKKIRHWEDVSTIIREYYSNPEKTFEKAKRGLQ
ncbi:MAG: type IV secretory pathway protein [Candidatus Heimdallarchaeota archaeon]|nr:type IV secretory pathway protein [Candidatus Heimdallarchaeota archaeon]